MRKPNDLRAVVCGFLRLAVALGTLTATGCNPNLTLPEAPDDLQALETEYESPNTPLNQETVGPLGIRLVDRVSDVRRTGTLDPIRDLFAKVQERTKEKGPPLDPGEPEDQPGEGTEILGTRIRGDGKAVVRLRQICRGWDPEAVPPVDESRDGVLRLTMTADRLGINPVVFGGFERCQNRTGGADPFRIELTGDVSVRIGGADENDRVHADNLDSSEYLFEYLGTARLISPQGEDKSGNITSTFRVTPSEGAFELLIQDDMGHSLVATGAVTELEPDGPTVISVGIRAQNGEWTCSVELDNHSGQCVNDESQELVEWP